MHGFELPHGHQRDGKLGRHAGVEIDALLQFVHVVDKSDEAVDPFEGLACIVVTVLGGGRDERAGRGLRRHAVGARIAAAGHFGECVLVKAEIGQNPVHLGFDLDGAGAREAGEVACLDRFDGRENVAEFLVEEAVQLLFHLGADDFGKLGETGQRLVGTLQLGELFGEGGQLFAKLDQLLVLQDLVFDHLPELLDALRDVLGVNHGHALRCGRGQGRDLQAKPEHRSQARFPEDRSHHSISLIEKSMKVASAMRALAWASSSAERTRVRAA